MVRVVLALVMVTGFCARGQGEMDALARGAVGLAQEEFGFGLLRAVADGDGDVAVSPVSVFEASSGPVPVGRRTPNWRGPWGSG
jgi:hypothetical protein